MINLFKSIKDTGSFMGGLGKLAKEYADMPPEKQAKVKKSFGIVTGATLAILGLLGGGYLILHHGKSKIDATKEDRKQQAQGKRETEVVKARGEAQKDCQVAIIEAKGREDRETIKAKAEFYKEKVASAIEKVQAIREIKKERKQDEKAARTTAVDLEDDSFDRDDYRDWLADFRLTYNQPTALPFSLHQIIIGVPDGYKEPMLSHLLQAYAALCFSRVRARYLDGKFHAANLQVVIEAPAGSGKDKFREVYDLFFEDTIKMDAQKMEQLDHLGNNNHASRVIIQTAKTSMSKARFVDTLANNRGVHFDLLETEISVVTRNIRSGKGALEYDYLRQAYDNDPVYRYTRSNAGRNGSFPIYLNSTFLGTTPDVNQFIEGQIDTGTAPRIIWAAIPRSGKRIPKLELPTGVELQTIRKLINDWRGKFCYSTQNGSDIPCNEYQIDLGFVASELRHWLDEQYDLAREENNQVRDGVRARIACTAFRMGMVLYMLYEEPSSRYPELRRQVVDWTIYMANYIMERYLCKFGPRKPIPPLNFAAHSSILEPTDKTPREQLREEKIAGLPLSMVEQMAADYYLGGIGDKKIAEKYSIYNKYGKHDRQRALRAILDYGLKPDKTKEEKATPDGEPKPKKNEDEQSK